jgi:hypothetical protein
MRNLHPPFASIIQEALPKVLLDLSEDVARGVLAEVVVLVSRLALSPLYHEERSFRLPDLGVPRDSTES